LKSLATLPKRLSHVFLGMPATRRFIPRRRHRATPQRSKLRSVCLH
jgi:hypothetical protein